LHNGNIVETESKVPRPSMH